MFQTLLLSASLCIGQPSGDPIKQLGHPHFAVRDQAHKRLLREMDFSLYFYLKAIKTTDPEVVYRRRLLMDAFEEKKAKYFRPEYLGKVDLGGYPKIPWICQEFSSRYEWNGLNSYQITNHYVGKSRKLCDLPNSSPDYHHHRVATELWLGDRIEAGIKNAVILANSETEFRCYMGDLMVQINEDVAKMIEGEDQWWRFHRFQNPLRTNYPKEK